jgi:hypothetical protein
MDVLADSVPYSGQTSEHRRVVIEVRGRAVVGVRAGITRYPCADFGDTGGFVVRGSGRATIGRDGRFRFSAGEPAQRITVSGVRRTRTHRITGTLRVVGSIATGQKCASGTLRFTATR